MHASHVIVGVVICTRYEFCLRLHLVPNDTLSFKNGLDADNSDIQ